jgi:hypothetical protein
MAHPHTAILPNPHIGFSTHKYLLVAIVECLQAQHPRRSAPAPAQRKGAAGHRWMREPSAERERTPCIVMREHHDRGDLSVAAMALERMALQTLPLAHWMRLAAPASSNPDRDTLHLAMAPTLPSVPIVVHSIAAGADSVTHMYSEGVWSVCADDQFLLRAIRYAQLVATTIPLSGAPANTTADPASASPSLLHDGRLPCDLKTLGLVYDHIGVHAAISELREFRRNQKRQRVAPLAGA